MSSILADLPLFPLHTVLFPDGLLPLKIFEARYLDMMRDCLRDQSPFGVCMIRSGNEVARPDEPTVPESVGCLAHLLDCDVQEYGLMQIKVKGGHRFRLLSTRVEPSGLLRGMAEPIGEDPPPDGRAYLAPHAACAEVLERIIKGVADRDPNNVPFLKPYRFEDPIWLSNRLAEILPIPLRARQKLMEIEDAEARLEIVHHFMQQHQML
ncbi:LON peptidase substrate-binding domain-containing protein [Pararobbsia silviterrae]|uniref:ATP-dependent protease n=1 Tax=Pararobbsia silviterrae TaxID=1792498 RepID=A0A494Y9N7_9BURK|nr:LON peptidase substrate-binding domain-containing protein [Pararobbsia silviterrae]RKP58835.1 ATP-dependent protease [Pararobbsia silviterrae]